MNRRKFIKSSALAGSAICILPAMACTADNRKTGLILYTVRDLMNEDPAGTLDKVASAGYNWIESASYSEGLFYGMKPAEFSAMVAERGMEHISSHIGVSPDNLDKVIEASAAARLKYVVLPSLPHEWTETADGFKQAADFMNKAGDKFNQAGIKFGFHNHKVEFRPVGSVIPFNILATNTDPDMVTFELDLAWITAAGQNPLDYLEKYAGRFELFHVKDVTLDGKDTTLGEGIIDFKPIFNLAETAGMKYFFIEQDDCRTHTPMESISISRDYLLRNAKW